MNKISTTVAELRVLVAYLGEKNQANWWGSEFYSANAAAFLAPIFNRSLFQAQYQGGTAAAAKVHDEAIGIGRIYHLFRLPIGYEQAAGDIANDEAFKLSLQTHLQNFELALTRLGQLVLTPELAAAGPMKVGDMGEDLLPLLQKMASIYHSAFSSQVKTFPYIRELE
jgi:hypothetical protein